MPNRRFPVASRDNDISSNDISDMDVHTGVKR